MSQTNDTVPDNLKDKDHLIPQDVWDVIVAEVSEPVKEVN